MIKIKSINYIKGNPLIKNNGAFATGSYSTKASGVWCGDVLRRTLPWSVKPSFNGLGINLAWLEFGSARSPWNILLDKEPVQHLADSGLTFYRVPLIWERIQPVLYQQLDLACLDVLIDALDKIDSVGGMALVDLHNYTQYRFANGTLARFGSEALPNSAFADLWFRLSQKICNHPALYGYDIMNEPCLLPSYDVWPKYAQAAISAIREVDKITPIFVEGNNWSSAEQWLNVNAGLENLIDPANNLIFSAHCYLDRDNSGSHYDWDVELQNGSYFGIGAARISKFVTWLNRHGFRGHIGELGAGSSSGWLIELQNTIDYIKSNNLLLTGWAAGQMWGTYPYSLQPDIYQDKYMNKPQIACYQKASGVFNATLFDEITDRKGQGLPTTIRIYSRGRIQTPLTINLTTTSGVLSANSVVLPAGENTSVSFTITLQSGSTEITYQRTDSGQVPPIRGYSVETTYFTQTPTATIQNVFSLRKINPEYTGPCCTIRRASDNSTKDIYFSSVGIDAPINIADALSFKTSEEDILHVVTWYDQSGNQNNAVPIFSDNSQGKATLADQPILIPNGLNGLPLIRWTNNRMDAKSPINGATKFSTFIVQKPIIPDRLLSWSFTDDYIIGDTFVDSNESSRSLPMGLDTSSWHSYMTTHTCSSNGTGFRRVFKDGVLVGSPVPNFAPKISFAYRSNVNIGWFRWWESPRYSGDITEMIILRDDVNALTSSFAQSAKTYWGY